MDKSPENDLTRVLLASGFIILLAVGCLWIMSPFVPAIIWATTLVVSTWGLLLRLEKRFNNKRAPAVVVMMIAMALIVLIPLVLAFSTFLAQSEAILAFTRNIPNMKIPPPPQWLMDFPFGEPLKNEWIALSQKGPESLRPILQPYARKAVSGLLVAAGSTGIFFLHLLLAFVVSGVLFATGEKAAAGLIRFGRRLAGDRGESAIILAGQSIKAVSMGIVVTAVIQTVLAGAGLAIAGVPYAGLLTAVVLVLCVAQLGPLIPLLIGVAWLYSNDHNTAGTVLLAWSLFVGLMDNFLRPYLIKKGADLPFLLILSGVIGGLFAFGVVGLFIGPVVLAVSFRLLQAWIEGRVEQKSEEADWPPAQRSYRTDLPPPESRDLSS
jgi:predicted PurR-regulated permease PerM